MLVSHRPGDGETRDGILDEHRPHSGHRRVRRVRDAGVQGDDRLEVTSPGSLHFGLTPEMLFAPHESRPWNPLIARTFYRRGAIEEWGIGTLRMAEMVSDAGLPPLDIDDAGGTVTVRFRHGQFVPQRRARKVSPAERRQMILTLLDGAKNGLTRREIYARLRPNVSERQVRRSLEELQEEGLVTSPGRGRLWWKRGRLGGAMGARWGLGRRRAVREPPVQGS